MLKSLGLAFRWCSHCVAQIAQLAQAHVFRVGSMTASALKKLKIGGSSSGDFELVNSSPREKVVEISGEGVPGTTTCVTTTTTTTTTVSVTSSQSAAGGDKTDKPDKPDKKIPLAMPGFDTIIRNGKCKGMIFSELEFSEEPSHRRYKKWVVEHKSHLEQPDLVYLVQYLEVARAARAARVVQTWRWPEQPELLGGGQSSLGMRDVHKIVA